MTPRNGPQELGCVGCSPHSLILASVIRVSLADIAVQGIIPKLPLVRVGFN